MNRDASLEDWISLEYFDGPPAVAQQDVLEAAEAAITFNTPSGPGASNAELN